MWLIIISAMVLIILVFLIGLAATMPSIDQDEYL